MDLHEWPGSGESTGEQVPRCHRQQFRERHQAADLDLYRRREPEVGGVMRRLLAAGAVIAVGVGMLISSAPAQAAEASGTITGLAGKCLDVAGANTADGTAVQIYDCNGTGAQNWTRSTDGT